MGIRMVVRTPDGRTLNTREWERQAHEVVFDALERSLQDVEFPRSKEELLEAAGGDDVMAEPRVPLRPFLETLPRGTYGDEDAVAEALNRTWRRADVDRFGLDL